MKTVVWASMQSLDVLQVIDLMLPNLVDEDEVEGFVRKQKSYGTSRTRGRSNVQRSGRAVVGVALVAIGIAMVIPGPMYGVMFMTGMRLGGGLNFFAGVAAVVAYVAVGLLLILVGSVLIYTA